MADFNQTVSNSLNCLGGKSSQKWGSGGLYPMVWGVSLWGIANVLTQVDQGITVSNSLTLDSLIYKDFVFSLSNSLSMSAGNVSETLQDSRGYYYNFYRPSSNAEDRTNNSYTQQSATSPTYTSLTVSVSTWS